MRMTRFEISYFVQTGKEPPEGGSNFGFGRLSELALLEEVMGYPKARKSTFVDFLVTI
jgi:hypothetical protein